LARSKHLFAKRSVRYPWEEPVDPCVRGMTVFPVDPAEATGERRIEQTGEWQVLCEAVGTRFCRLAY
jgi:hypothetical protein